MNDMEENQVKSAVGPTPPAAAGDPATAADPAPHAAAATNGVSGAKKSFLPAVLAARKPLLVRGNPLHVVRGTATAAAGGLLAFVFMALEAQYRWGVTVGIVGLVIASFGILDFFGTFDDPDTRVAASTTGQKLRTPALSALGAFFATLVFIDLTVQGRLPIAAAAVLVTASFVALVVTVFQTGVALGPWAKDELGEERPLFKRHGFWVVLAGVLLYLPMQGSYSLSDPWETHYGEVAREMLARNDWISTWWAQDGWFWSKPVLDFWMQAVVMSIFGVNYRPGEMLESNAQGHTPWPEWAVRMPVFVLAILALYVLYKGVAKVFGRRAGMLGALILATMPQWYLLAHQTITDMPLVACLSISMGLLLIGMHTADDETLRAYELSVFGKKIRLTGFHLVFGVILMTALPQILYLLSRNVGLEWHSGAHGFRWHLDEFWSGSKGNCGLPGNEACTPQRPVNTQFQPSLQALMWAIGLGAVLFINWGERRKQRMYFLAAWYFAAVATLGKGPAGFGLPICVTFTYIAATQKWQKLLTLEIASGLLLILVIAIPWYLAMYIRHGQPFTDRLIFHDMYKRAMTHVHDTNEGDDVSFRFYIWQLGYALFPWTGLVPAGLVWWTRRRDDAAGGQGDVSVFLAMWFVFAFGLFTAMLTKFHHYIFPAVPPAAMLTGILVDRMLGRSPLAAPGKMLHYLIGAGLSSLLTAYGLIRIFPGTLLGFRGADGSVQPGSFAIGVPAIVVGIGLAIAAAWKFGGSDETPEPEAPEERRRWRHEEMLLGGVGVAAAIVVALVGRDLAAKSDASDVPGQARLIHLFTYNYRRLWPDSLEFSGVLAGFAVLATALCLLSMVSRLRRHVTVLLLGTSLLWAVWGLDVYLVKAAPHWGQREVIEAYFKMRGSSKEPIIAYQMNWKGENFYTGNEIPAFVSSGAAFTNYLKAQQEKGIKTMWFVTEHSRTSSLKNEAANPKVFEMVTDRRLNNKFCLVKAVYD